ncbi:inner membrane protein YiaA [bacterium]|jgi:uncharacterized membrane protein YiaA|nr:inner membrane protein YiaA [bacterium]
MNTVTNHPTSKAFAVASMAAMAVGTAGFLVGLWNAEMHVNEKGFYFTILAFGMYSAISIQKCVRDRAEGIQVSPIYLGLSWAAIATAIGLLVIGLYNANTLALSEKGFYGIAYVLCIFTAVTVQKNTRDLIAEEKSNSIAARDESTVPPSTFE